MKILYVGREGNDAEAAVTALRGIAQNLPVSWMSRLDDAARWIAQNEDLAALVVDAEGDRTGWRPVFAHVRRLRPRPPIVVITPENAGPEFDEMEADARLTKNESWRRDLPLVVSRALHRTHMPVHATDTANALGGIQPPAGERQTQAVLQLERAARADLDRQLAHARAALQETEERCRTAIAAAAEQAARQQAQYDIGMARAAATWEMVDEQLREAALEVARSRRDRASAAAEVDRLARRETELSSLVADAAAARLTLERRLADAETALEAATARAADELRTAAHQLTEQRRDLEAQIAREIENRTVVEQTLARAVSERESAEQRHQSAIADAVARSRELEEALRLAQQNIDSQAVSLDQIGKREAELTSMLADAATIRADLERRLAATEAAFQGATAGATRERLAAARRAAEREAALDTQIQDERAARAGLERSIAERDAALQDAERRHEVALHDAEQRHEAASAAAARERAEREAQLDRELAETSAARDSLGQRLAGTETVLEQERQERESAAAAVERLTRREAELVAQLADARADRESVELRLTATVAEAEERAARERVAAADRQGDLEAQLADTVGSRDTLERMLAETRSAAADAERSFTEEIDGLRTRALEAASQFDACLAGERQERDSRLAGQRQEYEARLAGERREHESRLAEAEESSRQLTLERDALRQSLDATEAQLGSLREEHRDACQRFEQTRTAADGEISRLTTERDEIAHALDVARGNFQDTLDRRSNEQSLALAARDHKIEELQRQLTAATENLRAAEQRQETLQREADRVPQLVRQIDESRAESERLFQQAPVAMFRCRRDGTLLQANRAWSALVRRGADELRSADFAAAIFESPNELSWLIDQCVRARTKESIETTLRREDGARLFVRLSAGESAPGVVEIVAEDLTRPRILQHRLAQAGRMEAVGRLASEVALTCGKLVSDARQNAQQWLMDATGTAASRAHGETLVDEMTRAASYLQQLVAYGDKETRAPTLVDLHTVVRDLAPVLKHVAGDDVDVRLPDAPPSLTVDVDAERVERVLVNVAAYGRGRMPFGGRLTIEVGTSIVDRQFAAKFPNVRPGPHALITVTEVRRAAKADGLLQLRNGPSAQHSRVTVGRTPGIHLETLQGLVGECGGHLWMKVQPLGDIVAKIRLPLLTSYGQTAHAHALAARGGRARTMTRWFPH